MLLKHGLPRDRMSSKHLIRRLRDLFQDESGQDTIEYVLVATLLALSAMAVLRAYNVHVVNTLNGLGNQLTKAI